MRRPLPTNLVNGYRAIEEAFEANKTFDKLLISTSLQGDTQAKFLQLCKDHKAPFQKVPKEKLNRITNANHQGLIGFISPIDFHPLEEVVARVFEEGKQPFFIALDEVSDIRNFGAIARTANCAGVDALIIPFKGSAAINEDAIKTSAGALFHIPVCKVDSMKVALNYLQMSGVKLVGLTEKTETSFFDIDLKTPVCLVMGSEEKGLSSNSFKQIDELGKLPMFGEVSSLNVSVAAGIAMYETLKQRAK